MTGGPKTWDLPRLRELIGDWLGRRARQLLRAAGGELGEDLDPEGEVVAFSYGERPGQYLDVDALESAMADEVGWNPLPGDLVAKLAADRDRFLSSLTRLSRAS
jgi:hypothetical protein